ncbi:MAG: 16S rRNA (cytosine(967)-C(5))-methyltransferase RsmB, partial [Limnobacter sp.]|nr:16S rRNA (cytosine(967)-C(5))-methyltransferase RsmB [Limnobacter sp.]
MLKASAVLYDVIHEGFSLDSALAHELATESDPATRGAIQDLSYFGMRWWGRGSTLAELVSGRTSFKPEGLGVLLSLALALLFDEGNPKYPAFTVVNETVKAAAGHPAFVRGKAMLNACLRNFLRERSALLAQLHATPHATYSYPQW